MSSLHAKEITNIELSPRVKKLHDFVDGLPEPFKKSARYWLKKFAKQLLEQTVALEQTEVKEIAPATFTKVDLNTLSVDDLFTMGREDIYAKDRTKWNKEILALNHGTINEWYERKMIDWKVTYANDLYIVVPIGDGGLVVDRKTKKVYSKDYFSTPAILDPNEFFRAKLGDIFADAA